MRDRSDHIICAVATANGFAMPYRPSAPSAHPDKKHELRDKEVRPPVRDRLPVANASSRREG